MSRRWSVWRAAGLALIGGVIEAAPAPPSFSESLAAAAREYREALAEAGRGWQAVREDIRREQEPLLVEIRQLEERVVALESELARTERFAAEADDLLQLRAGENEAAAKTLAYLATLAHDQLELLEKAQRPGHARADEERRLTWTEQLESAARPEASPGAGLDAALAIIEQVAQRAESGPRGVARVGEVVVMPDHQVVRARILHVGPESFFVAEDAPVAGVVRNQPGAPLPIAYPTPDWDPAQARRLAAGEPATVWADPSGGRALQLEHARGSLFEHVRKGGGIGLVILALGVVALVIAVLKALSLRQLVVDDAATVRRVLHRLASESPEDPSRVLAELHATTRELFATGLRHWGKAKEVLEERLYGVWLQLRLRNERLLPLLAVIATAAPLLGLLGTVTGMVKTFTLITVHGTGHAAKLSSGISEALVTTELGLIVAIPTLLAHGYLSHRVRRNLALLEAHTHELATLADEMRNATVARSLG